ncbi:MAG: shikimate dehydrogenase [Gammaproteobacteria bacterium]|nr:shikimate dehydrogenase [Gammaproteobacteria bacterium]
MTDLFDFHAPPKLYAVMGNPVAHSKSPQIHTLFATQCGIRIDYRAIQVDLGGFEQAVSNFQASGGQGLNVTVPFKLEAWKLATERSARAERAGAVNTLKFSRQGERFGDNTDGVGLVRDMVQNLNRPVCAANLLIVGAGGAVRGVLGPLLAEQPKLLVVANRTIDRAAGLADLFAHDGHIQVCGLPDLAGQSFDIVINATAAGLSGEVPELPDGLFTADALGYDLMYADEPTAFMRWAKDHGATHAVDGLGMLVEQAAESFFIWHDRKPETAPVIATLRQVT